MSKLARALALAAMLTAMQLAGMTALAQAHATDQPTGQADATVRRLQAQERYYGTWGYENPTTQRALAQERAYRTSGYGSPSAPASAEPGEPAGWLTTPALGLLAVVLAVSAGAAVLATRRPNRGHRAELDTGPNP
jgi:hypothetical protein